MANIPLVLLIWLLGACLGAESTGGFLSNLLSASLLGAGGVGTVCHWIVGQLVLSHETRDWRDCCVS